MFLPTPCMMGKVEECSVTSWNRGGSAHSECHRVIEESGQGTGCIAGTALCMAPNHLFFLQVCVHSSGRVPTRLAGDIVFHGDDFCICELLAWWTRLPLVLGSAQLAGSDRGEWSPEAGGDPVHPGQPGEQEPGL